MKPMDLDLKEQAFIEQALAAAARAQRWERVRVVVTLAAAFSAAIWLAFRAPSPELGVECTIVIVIGSIIATATAKLRSLIQHNTRLILQALAATRPQADSMSPGSADH